MTPIEIIAMVFIIVAGIKLAYVIIKPQSWIGVVNKVWSNPLFTAILSLILSAVVLYYLLQAGITIVQILAVAGFIGLLAGVGIAPFHKDIIGVMKKLLKQRVIKKAWLSIVIWIILIIWGLKELLIV